MHHLIGIDTGDTYTDAVLFDEQRGVLAKAKALTTRADLALGIDAVLDAVLGEGGSPRPTSAWWRCRPRSRPTASSRGSARVCLVAIGFAPANIERAGPREAVKNDDVVVLAGGHDSFGEELALLDLGPLRQWIAIRFRRAATSSPLATSKRHKGGTTAPSLAKRSASPTASRSPSLFRAGASSQEASRTKFIRDHRPSSIHPLISSTEVYGGWGSISLSAHQHR